MSAHGPMQLRLPALLIDVSRRQELLQLFLPELGEIGRTAAACGIAGNYEVWPSRCALVFMGVCVSCRVHVRVLLDANLIGSSAQSSIAAASEGGSVGLFLPSEGAAPDGIEPQGPTAKRTR